MKITKSNLQKIINEELKKELEEGPGIKNTAIAAVAAASAIVSLYVGTSAAERVKKLEKMVSSANISKIPQNELEEVYNQMFGEGKAKADRMTIDPSSLQLFAAGLVDKKQASVEMDTDGVHLKLINKDMKK